MKLLLTITLVICGCSQILARAWFVDDSDELFGWNTDGIDDYDYDVARLGLQSETRSPGSNDDDDDDDDDIYSGSTYNDKQYSTILSQYLSSLPDDDDLDEDYKPTAEATSEEASNESTATEDDEKDEDYTPRTDDSSEELFTLDWSDSTEDNKEDEDVTETAAENKRFIFSAHLGFNTDDLVTVNLLSTDNEGHVQKYHYNTYAGVDQSSPNKENYSAADIEVDSLEETHNDGSTNDEIVELLRPNSAVASPMTYRSQQADLLQKLSLSSSNSELLKNAYSDNVLDFVAVQRNLKSSLDMMQRQNDQLYEELFDSAGDRNDYNSQQHMKIVADMAAMLSKIDEAKSEIEQMQRMEEQLNYHLLLNALLTEIYSGKNDL